jgi:hypothetical protein
MRAFQAILREVWSLFVEDASLTAGILLCVALARYLLPTTGLPAFWRGPLLFLMLACMLLENVYRSTRR